MGVNDIQWTNMIILEKDYMCHNPNFGRMGGWHSHSQNGDLGVCQDSRNFRIWLQGSKHLTLRCCLYHWKAIKVKMSKMGSHEPFGHL